MFSSFQAEKMVESASWLKRLHVVPCDVFELSSKLVFSEICKKITHITHSQHIQEINQM